jgi:hypothetical protein
LNFAGADLLVNARAVLLGGLRRFNRTANGYCLLLLIATRHRLA